MAAALAARPTGPFRLFQSEFGGQISWLIPAALVSLVALAWISRRAVRTSRVRAFALLWGGWLVVTGLVFSYMQGIIHPYYMVALAPAIGALVGVGAMSLWQAGLPIAGRVCAAVGVLGSGAWAYVLLDRTPAWLPWLRWTVLLAGLLGAAALFAVPAMLRGTPAQAALRPGGARRAPMLAYAPLALALVAGLGGPLAYSLDTANTTHTGAIPSAGPTVAGAFGGGPGGAGGPGGGFGGGTGRPGGATGTGTRTGNAPSTAGGFPGGPGSAGGNNSTGAGTAGTGAAAGGTGTQGGVRGTAGTRGAGSTGGPGGGGVAMGGLSGGTEVSSALIKLLEQDSSQYKWIAATEGSQSAAPIELATGGDAVMAIGGFNGTDPSPTLAEFEAMVAKHEIHYYVGQSNNSFGGGTGSSAIASWVTVHFKAETVGGVTVYNLTQQK